MQIAAGESVSWDGTAFGDELVGEDVVEFYAQHAKAGRFKYLAATKFIPEALWDELRNKLKLSTISMDSIKGEAFALMYEIDSYEEGVTEEGEKILLYPDKKKVINYDTDEELSLSISLLESADYYKSLQQELKTTFPKEAAMLADPTKPRVIKLFEDEYAKFAKKNNYQYIHMAFYRILPLLYQDYNYLSDNYKTKEEVEKLAPSYFRTLEEIKDVDVWHGEVSLGTLQFLPVSIFGLHGLKSLTIAGLNNKPDDEVLEKLGNLTELSELSLQNCGLESLPASIGNLKKLRILNLKNNNLKYLPESIVDLPWLTAINLDDNELLELPESIGRLRRMDELIVSNNKLKAFPASIGNLWNIIFIVAHNNQIESLPDEIGDLSRLIGLALDNNNLTALPETINKLANLTNLRVMNNNLTTIPESVLNMPKLNDLREQLKIQKKQ